MKPRLRPLLIVAVLAALSPACDDTLEPAAKHEGPGLLIYRDDTTHVFMPETVMAGETFTIFFSTIGLPCTTETARTETKIEGNVIDIRPFDVTSFGGVCNDVLHALEHRVEVRLRDIGVGTVRVIGSQRGSGSGWRRRSAQLEKSVIVR